MQNAPPVRAGTAEMMTDKIVSCPNQGQRQPSTNTGRASGQPPVLFSACATGMSTCTIVPWAPGLRLLPPPPCPNTWRAPTQAALATVAGRAPQQHPFTLHRPLFTCARSNTQPAADAAQDVLILILPQHTAVAYCSSNTHRARCTYAPLPQPCTMPLYAF